VDPNSWWASDAKINDQIWKIFDEHPLKKR
jgi:hypothetical protein